MFVCPVKKRLKYWWKYVLLYGNQLFHENEQLRYITIFDIVTRGYSNLNEGDKLYG